MRFPGSKLARRITAATSAVALLASIGASAVLAGGPPGLAFYVDDVRYRTVGTPSDFTGTGAPGDSYDRIYVLGDGLVNVAESKPGDTDFSGGRWIVLPIIWADGVTPVQYTNDWQILQAQDAGLLTIGATPLALFECPVIPVQGSQQG